MKAVLFGPGRVGCGFAGHLLWESGYELVFAARNRQMADHLNRVGRYVVRLVGQGSTREIVIDGVRAVWTGESERVADEMADASLITTSVTCNGLPAIGPFIAKGLGRRKDPVNVIAFENFGTASDCLEKFLASCGPTCSSSMHGISPGLVSRVVSEQIGDPAGDEPFLFIGDHAGELIVDGQKLIQPIPAITGMKVVHNFPAWIQRKLFMFSAGHATTAYLGYLKGYHYIHTAIQDPEIRETVLAAMREGQEGLRARYGQEIAGEEKDLADIVARFENAFLNDSIERVGRDPLRKLEGKDRLVGSARLAEDAGISPEKLMFAAAAALFYCNQSDSSCSTEQEDIEDSDLIRIFYRVSGLDPAKPISRLALKTLSDLFASRCAEGECAEGPLLSLDNFFWA